MLIQHPEALAALPRETLIFDWQYETGPRKTTQLFREKGFDVVCCPAVRSYDAAWCHLGETQRIIDEHAGDAAALGALGMLLTTWEFSFFTQYAATLPVIMAVGRRLVRGEEWSTALRAEGGAVYARAAEILGKRIPEVAEFLKPGTWRQLRDRLVIRQNPFTLWQAWHEEACGPVGDEILRLCDEASRDLPAEAPLQFAIELHRVAVDWVRLVQRAHRLYAEGNTAACRAVLEEGDGILERLRPGLVRAAAAGGSAADVARLDLLQHKAARATPSVWGTLQGRIGRRSRRWYTMRMSPAIRRLWAATDRR